MAHTVPEFGLGDRMRKARELAGLDQADLASRLGVSRALVSMWERGLSDPRSGQVRQWADETDQPMWWLLDLDPATLTDERSGSSVEPDLADVADLAA